MSIYGVKGETYFYQNNHSDQASHEYHAENEVSKVDIRSL